MKPSVYEKMRQTDEVHWWFVARRKILRAALARLALPRDARVLEVGCGPGGNLEMLQAFGAVSAMEMDRSACQVASDRSGIEVVQGSLPDALPFEAQSFDLIAALDVIEHVEQDRESVAALARLLKPGGAMIVTVPAYAWLWSEHDEEHHHKRRYVRAEVAKLMRAAQLDVIKCGYFNTLLFPLVALIRTTKKLFGFPRGSDDDMPGALVNNVLQRIMASERALIRLFPLPFGSSILCIGRRT